MSLPQRVVIVVAVGLAVLASWVWWYTGSAPSADDWFAYAPDTQTSTDTYYIVRDRQPEYLAIPLLLIILWSAFSLWLLAPSAHDSEESR